MTRTSTLLLATAFAITNHAQTTWWGMTAAGGANGIGTIYSITEASVYTKHHEFFRFEGAAPKGEVVKASNGLYYGVTELGGSEGMGVLFSYNPTTSTYTILRNFSATTTTSSAVGGRPIRGPVIAPNGRLYGTCSIGGLNNLGTMWEYNISTSTFLKRFDFDALTTGKGSTPRGRLMVASNGLIYGTTQLGGANGRGCIFSYSPAASTNIKVYNFPALPAAATGAQPFGGLVQATGGLLYGTTSVGGANGFGTLYSFNITGAVFTSLHDFATATGRSVLGELAQAANGNIYGAASAGGTNSGGVIFGYTIGTDTYTPHVHLSSATGTSPFSRMLVASDGKLYGTCNQGGTNNNGVIYSFNPTTNAYTVEYEMSTGGYSDVWGGVIEDPAGTLLCLATDGGTASEGAFLRLNLSTDVITELVSFSLANGATPKGKLMLATNGKFYGVTSAGGPDNLGILFSYDPGTSTFARLADFNTTVGTFPLGTLVQSGNNLYGVCSNGGTNNNGTLFEFAIATSTLTKKKDLALLSTGYQPQNGLFKAANGKLYGNTSAGAANGLGGIFEYIPSTNTITNLVAFSVTTGSQPLADFIQGSNGLLYGTCSNNGPFTKGTLFSFNTTTNAITALFNFEGLQGGVPAGEVVQANNGKLYGTTREDGQGFSGNIYSWDIATSTYTEEYSFNLPPVVNEGRLSEANLIKGADGLLYGTCSQGGTSDLGVVFRFNTASPGITNLVTFTGTANGQYPFDGLVSNVLPATNISANVRAFLDGPYNTVSGSMNADLRTLAGANGFPTTEPFTAAGFTIVGGGGESINASVLSTTGSNAVVDWVLLELRDKNAPATILRTKACLVQSDGDIMDVDNSSTPSFALTGDNYYVAVRHRNHFGVMTSTAVALAASPVTIDFTSAAQGTYGTGAQKVVGSVRTMFSGNTVRNNTLLYLGSGNDRDPILVRVGGSTPNNTVVGYYSEDVNMNGTVSYVGAGNDRDPILVNIGGSTPNNTLTEQLP